MSEEERINKNVVLAAAQKASLIARQAKVRDTLEDIVCILQYIYIYIYIFCFVFILILFFILYFM